MNTLLEKEENRQQFEEEILASHGELEREMQRDVSIMEEVLAAKEEELQRMQASLEQYRKEVASQQGDELNAVMAKVELLTNQLLEKDSELSYIQHEFDNFKLQTDQQSHVELKSQKQSLNGQYTKDLSKLEKKLHTAHERAD